MVGLNVDGDWFVLRDSMLLSRPSWRRRVAGKKRWLGCLCKRNTDAR
jgi:hypothetical protein